MAKKKSKAYRVVMRPEGGGAHPNDPERELVRYMEVYAESPEAAREYAVESALAESQEHDRPVYQVESVEPV